MKLSEFTKEELIELIGIYSKNWLAMDGVWFQSVEQQEGMDAALFHDACAWERFTVVEARRIKAFLGLEKLRESGKAFYGAENIFVPVINTDYPDIKTPQDLYDALSNVWCRETCAPRLQNEWTEENKTLGQCSVTAFLAQDLFGGKVYGIRRQGGNYHCYNEVEGKVFDLTSGQFRGEKLDYRNNPEQLRELHFAKAEKYERYLYLKGKLAEFAKVKKLKKVVDKPEIP